MTATFHFWMHAENTKDLNKYGVKYLRRILGSIYVYTNSKFLLAMEKAVLSFTSCFAVLFFSILLFPVKILQSSKFWNKNKKENTLASRLCS